MRYFADLHIHSKYARATSKSLNIDNIEKYARIKGVNLLGTGDFTHPEWIKEIKSKLNDDGSGIYKTATGFPFVLQTELSLVHTQGGKGRRIHHLILSPSTEVVDQITEFLLSKGRIDYDGRPIFGMSSIELAEKLHEISADSELIPAHAWTPWFGVLGSKSGFDSIKECFEEKSNLIHAIETGMSSDPSMNWRVKSLDNTTLLSNSDLHSYWPWRIGREANVFEFEKLSYKAVLAAIRERKGFLETIEVDPGYGKYHVDGHSKCGVWMQPAQTNKNNGICHVCKKALTIGVLNRVEQLSDREEGYKPKDALPFKKVNPLTELIVAVNGSSLAAKKTWEVYNKLITSFGNEFSILLDTSEQQISKIVGAKLAEVIIKNRAGDIKVQPGYDGEYGKLNLTDEAKPSELPTKTQMGLGDF